MAKGRKRPASELDKASSGQPAAVSAAGGEDGSVPGTVTPSTNKNEIRFGRHLASSDKRVRDQTVSALREWLFQRSRGGVLTELDLLKIWRGLWYCMFMCDKAPIQRELAQNLASLIHLFKSDRAEGARFFRSFCVTMQRDWERIDHLRIDKYYTLVRLFVREAIGFCRVRRHNHAAAPAQSETTSPEKPAKKKQKKRSGSDAIEEKNARDGDVANSRGDAGDGGEWDIGLLRAVVAAVEDEILTVYPAPFGLRLHVADIWVEACEAGGEDMPTEALLMLLAPWLRAAAAPETNAVVFKRACEGVFQGLLAVFSRGGEEERVFKKVDLAKVQACVFEVAAAPQTREKRRVDLYKLHREYQKLTGVSPDVNAPPSGIFPLPPEEPTDSEEDDGEFVEAGARARAVRGPEPPVTGWVAAGIASGDIAADGSSGSASKGDKGKRGKGGGGENHVNSSREKGAGREDKGEEEEEPKREKTKRGKKRKKGIDRAEGQDGGDRGHANKVGADVDVLPTADGKDQKDDTEVIPAADSATAGAASDSSPAKLGAKNTPLSSGKKKSKKRKSEELVAPRAETPKKTQEGGVKSDAWHPPVSSAVVGNEKGEGDRGTNGASNGASPVPGQSPLPSPAHKRKKRESGQGNGKGDVGVGSVGVSSDSGASVEVVSEPAGSAVDEGSPSAGDELNDAGADKTTQQESSAERKKKKKAKKKSTSPGNEPRMSPIADNPSARSDPSLRTPPKASGNGSTPVKTPGKGGGAKKTVTFGVNTAKEHMASVKDLKTRVITPSKDSGTPEKGLLKVAGGTAIKPTRSSVGRKGTPSHRSKRASDFF